MNRQLQIELWPECRCNRCSFCNLALGSVIRGTGEENNPNRFLSSKEKKPFLEKALTFLSKVDWSNYDTLLIRGGEVFNDYEESLLESYTPFIESISRLLVSGTLKKVFLITSLKYEYAGSLLQYTLDTLQPKVDICNKVLVGTSWDKKYRFTSTSLTNWKTNIDILDSKNIPVHITSILTQAFIEGFNENDKDVLAIMDRDFDFIAAQGKPELLKLDKFFPKRKDCLLFLSQLNNSIKYTSILTRLFSQHVRRAESIYFTETDIFSIRDLKQYSYCVDEEEYNKPNPKCGHPMDYCNYADSEACFICDIRTLFEESDNI